MAATEVGPNDTYSTRRWWVHLGLLASLVVSLLIVLAHMGVGLHIIAGLCFAGLVGAHLVQRQRTLRTLAGGLITPTLRTPCGRLAVADAVLAFLAANVVLSGIADWMSPQPVMVGLVPGVPPLNWHTTTSLLLVGYLVVHVVRRRARLRHSRVR